MVTNCANCSVAAIGSNSFGQIAPIAPVAAIESNSCGHIAPIAPVAAIGSNSCGDELRQLLQWQQLGAIRVVTNCANCSCGSNWEQFVWKIAQIAPVGAIGSNSCGDELRQLLPWEQLGAIRVVTNCANCSRDFVSTNCVNCSRGSNWEQFVWTNCANCSRGSNWEQFGWTNSANCSRGAIGSNSCGPPIAPWDKLGAFRFDKLRQLLPWEQLGAIRVDKLRQLLAWEQLGAIRLDKFRQLLPWEQLGAIRVVTNCANCSRGSNWEQLVWTNCANCSRGSNWEQYVW